MEIKKLGDALAYGLTQELPRLYNTDSCQKEKIYSSIAYLMLKGYICNATAHKLYIALNSNELNRDKKIEDVKYILELIMEELSYKIKYNTWEQLVEMLNKLILPEYCTKLCEDIISRCNQGIVLCRDRLFYISEEGRTAVLYSVRTNQIIFDDDSLDMQYSKETIMYGCEKLFGVDEKEGAVYFTKKRQNNFFYKYIMGGNLCVYPYELIGVRDGVLYVVKDGKNIVELNGGKSKYIALHTENAYYEQRNDGFVVIPQMIDSRFFTPFKIGFDGKRMALPLEEIKVYLWGRLEEIVVIKYYLACREFDEFELRIRRPDTMVFPEICRVLRRTAANRGGIPVKMRYKAFEEICDYFSTYNLDETKTVYLLYALYKANLLLENSSIRFPSKELKNKLREIFGDNNKEKEFKSYLDNCLYDELVKMIAGEPTDIKTPIYENGLIGTFDYSNGQITNVFAQSVGEGKIIGSQICGSNYGTVTSGSVSYDSSVGVYYITTDSILTIKARLIIIHKYKLESSRCLYLVNSK